MKLGGRDRFESGVGTGRYLLFSPRLRSVLRLMFPEWTSAWSLEKWLSGCEQRRKTREADSSNVLG